MVGKYAVFWSESPTFFNRTMQNPSLPSLPSLGSVFIGSPVRSVTRLAAALGLKDQVREKVVYKYPKFWSVNTRFFGRKVKRDFGPWMVIDRIRLLEILVGK